MVKKKVSINCLSYNGSKIWACGRCIKFKWPRIIVPVDEQSRVYDHDQAELLLRYCVGIYTLKNREAWAELDPDLELVLRKNFNCFLW